MLLALTNPVEGKDAEFRDWYWNTHIPEVMGLPGFVAVQRYRVPDSVTEGASHRYATIYEVEGSAEEAIARLFTAGVGMSDTLDLTTVAMTPFVPGD
jgi:hypothetical protein